MGRNKRGPRKPRDATYRSDVLEKSDMHNASFSAYYKAQNIISLDAEWDEFMAALRRQLPTSFRVAGSRLTANSLNTIIKETHVPSLNGVTFDGEKIPPPEQIPWYPDGLAWQFSVPKKVLRKQPEFKKFHSFLVFETEVGNISRSETVSMLPPLFLNVEPHHRVMDMCAAPGSKTAQILEALHANDTITASSTPSGLLLANDSDAKRTHLLIHQSARLPSPALMVTNLDASNYPTIKIDTGNGNKGRLLFDRILCDVPCSGDGTLRKNVGIWKHWGVGDGNGLHSLQVRILERAMKLLKPDAGSRIVYSTCSLNPVENEAVVAAALNSNPDFYLVDVSSYLPELKRRPGITNWRVTNNRSCQTTYSSYEEAPSKDKLLKTHWPPANVAELNLPRCLRIYPHLQDTGGFFIAVLERKDPGAAVPRKRPASPQPTDSFSKKSKVAANESAPSPEAHATPAVAPEAVSGKDDMISVEPIAVDAPGESTAAPPADETAVSLGSNGFKENPYTYLPSTDANLQKCIESLHLKPGFPSSSVFIRSPPGDSSPRSLYISNPIVKNIIQNNDYTRLRLTSAGTKVFARQGEEFRVLGEGVPVVLPYIDESYVIDVKGLNVLKTLVSEYYPPLSKLEDGEFKKSVEERAVGSHVVRIIPEEEDVVSGRLTHEIVLPLWKSSVSLALMVDKKAKSALSLRIFGEDVTAAGKQKESKTELNVEEEAPSAE